MTVKMDKLVLVNLKNRTGLNKLRLDINNLELLQRSDIRTILTRKKQFRSKFLKFEDTPPSRDKETWNVRMYETHNPGFCYHRTGKRRTSDNSPKRTSSETHRDLRDMFMTEGEVDIHKILCLHLLSAHSILPVGRTQSKVFAWRPFSPEKIMLPQPVCGPYFPKEYFKDRKIEENTSTELLMNKKKVLRQEKEKKKKSRVPGVKKLLPTYILDLKESDNDELEEDTDEEVELKTTELDTKASKSMPTKIPSPKRVLNRRELEYIPIVINNEIQSLIQSVMEVLLEVNPKKIRDLVALAKNPTSLRQIMSKPEIHDFLDSLHGKPFVCNSESFIMSNAYIMPKFEKNIRKKMDIEDLTFRRREGGEVLALRLSLKDTSITSSLDRLVGEIHNSVRILHAKSTNRFIGSAPPTVGLENQNTFTSSSEVNPPGARPSVTHSIKTSSLTSEKVARKRISKKALASVANLLNRNAAMSKKKKMMQTTNETASTTIQLPKVESRFCARKSTCPACIDRLKFAGKTPKHRLARSPIKFPAMRSQISASVATKYMSPKGIEEMVNIVSMYGSPQASYEVCNEEQYGDMYSMSRKSSTDSCKDNNVLNFILRRLTNSQRILLGRKAACLKTKSINNEGTDGKTRPLITNLLDSILPKCSILELAAYLKLKDSQISANNLAGIVKLMKSERSIDRSIDMQNLDHISMGKNYSSGVSLPTEKTTKVNLERLKYEVADQELRRRLTDFLNSPNP